jgi:hypothetical protein
LSGGDGLEDNRLMGACATLKIASLIYLYRSRWNDHADLKVNSRDFDEAGGAVMISDVSESNSG